MRIQRRFSECVSLYQTPEIFRAPAVSYVVRDRAVGFFPKPQSVWEDEEQFLNSKTVHRGVHSIWHNGLPVDFELSKGRADVLVVVFPGALQPGALLPVFAGANSTRGLNITRLSFSDPSLYLSPDLPLAWHAGNIHQPNLQILLTRIITKVQAAIGAKRIILFGSSGGGFAAMIQVAKLPHAYALVANPQTEILSYHEDHVQRYLNIAWSGDRKLFSDSVQSSVINAIRGSMADPKIFYMQNLKDLFHVKAHLDPFAEALYSQSNVQLLLRDWGDGHIAPPKNLFHEVINALATNDDFLLSNLGFSPLQNYKSE